MRLSATSTNDNWHQTNLPLPPNPETHAVREPRWATEIEQSVQHQLPRALAYQMVYNPENTDYDEELLEEEGEDDEINSNSDVDENGGNGDGDGDGIRGGQKGDEDDENNDDGEGDIAGMRGLDTSDQVHTTRMRIWGLTASPGKGVTAVFVSPHGTLKPDRITFGGMKFKVLFGRHVGIAGGGEERDEAGVDGDDNDEAPPPTTALQKLSTEARMWEWMYGGGPPVPGVLTRNRNTDSSSSSNRSSAERTTTIEGITQLNRNLTKLATSQLCPFCETRIKPTTNTNNNKNRETSSSSSSSACANGHVFENCAATGIPILAPGVSNTCAVCGSKCLKPGELLAIAAAAAAEPGFGFAGGDVQSVVDEISPELCGGCGGKFIN